MRRPRVLLAEDHQMLLDALKGLLEPSYQVVGAARDGHALIAAAQKLRPDVIVLDIAMPQLNGLEAGRRLKQLMPSVKLIFITMNEDPYMVGEAFRAGASAFLLKQAAALELNEAIDTVLKGGKYVTPLATAGLEKTRCGGLRPWITPGAQASASGRSFNYWPKVGPCRKPPRS